MTRLAPIAPLPALLALAPARARMLAGVELPEPVMVDGAKLVLNGMGLRQATVLRVEAYVGRALPRATYERRQHRHRLAPGEARDHEVPARHRSQAPGIRLGRRAAQGGNQYSGGSNRPVQRAHPGREEWGHDVIHLAPGNGRRGRVER